MKAPVLVAAILSVPLVLVSLAFLASLYGVSPFGAGAGASDKDAATASDSSEIEALKARVAELESLTNQLQTISGGDWADNAGDDVSPPATGSPPVPDGRQNRANVSFPSGTRQPAAASGSRNDGNTSGSRPTPASKSKRDNIRLNFVSIDCTHVGKDVFHHPLRVYQCPVCESVFISHCVHTGTIARHNREWRLSVSCKCHKTTGVERLPDESVAKWNALMKKLYP